MCLCPAALAFAKSFRHDAFMDTTHRAGQMIRELRQRHYRSVTDACNTVGDISRPTWENIERGQPAKDAKLARIDVAFGWPPSTTRRLRAGEIDDPPPVQVPTDVTGTLRTIAVQVDALTTELGQLRDEVSELRETVDQVRTSPP